MERPASLPNAARHTTFLGSAYFAIYKSISISATQDHPAELVELRLVERLGHDVGGLVVGDDCIPRETPPHTRTARA